MATRSYDTSLKTAYNFGFLNTKPEWVEFYPYTDGILINYWDTSYTDNNVGDHPGAGEILPIDAHPDFTHWKNGDLMRPRILSADSAFGRKPTAHLTVHNNGRGRQHPVEAGRADLRRHADLVVRRRPACGDRLAPGPLPARLVQREPAEDGHHDRGEDRNEPGVHPDRGASQRGCLELGRWQRALSPSTHEQQRIGRGKPRPITLSEARRRNRQATGGGTQGGAFSRTVALLPAAPRARIASGLPHGLVNGWNRMRKAPAAVAVVRRIRGPSRVTAVTVTRSPGANSVPAMTSGAAATTRSFGVRSICAAA